MNKPKEENRQSTERLCWNAKLNFAPVIVCCDSFQHYQISRSVSFWQLRATLLALLVLLVCRELEVAQWCETCPCDEIFAEYFY